MSNTEELVEIAHLQKKIQEYLGALEPESIIFDFEVMSDRKKKLNLITVNPRHRQSFLFHSTLGSDKIDALRKMMDYVQSYKEKESSYTIQWSLRGESELNTSYFRARNIFEALDKLTFGRDMNSIIVYSVVLNPIT